MLKNGVIWTHGHGLGVSSFKSHRDPAIVLTNEIISTCHLHLNHTMTRGLYKWMNDRWHIVRRLNYSFIKLKSCMNGSTSINASFFCLNCIMTGFIQTTKQTLTYHSPFESHQSTCANQPNENKCAIFLSITHKLFTLWIQIPFFLLPAVQIFTYDTTENAYTGFTVMHSNKQKGCQITFN